MNDFTTITGKVFAAVMVVVGAASGVVYRLYPELSTSVIPSFVWPLLAAFVFDLWTRPMIADEKWPPITTQTRFIGVIFATILGVLITHVGA